MNRHLTSLAAVVLGSLGLVSVCMAIQTEPPAPATSAVASTVIPDTPAGRQLRWSLGVLNGAEPGSFTDRFTPEFLEAVPEAKLAPVFAQLRTTQFKGGPVEIVRIESGASDTHLSAIIRHPPDGRPLKVVITTEPGTEKMTGLLFTVAPDSQIKLASWAELDAKLRELPGQTGMAVSELPAPGASIIGPALHRFRGEERLALGSTFKLYILLALSDLIRDGQARWDEKIPIREELKSLPSGDMQTQPAGTKFTLAEFAAKMISISDNTAADHLLARVGRTRVEKCAEEVAHLSSQHAQGLDPRTRPFLSTLEMFKIKLAEDRTLAARYAQADEPTRRAMLAPDGEVAKATPSILLAAAWKKPFEVDRVEWFASPDECWRLMMALRGAEQQAGMEPLSKALRLNPGIPFDRTVWKSIAFKGGSEPGVLNLTWLLEREDGRWFGLSMSWNNPKAALDDEKLLDLATAAVALLAQHDWSKSPSAEPSVGR